MKLQGLAAGIQNTEEIIRAIVDLSDELKRVLNEGLLFVDNFDGAEASVSDTGVADTEFSFSHGLGRIPTRYRLVKSDKATNIYDGDTANTDATMYLKSSTANCSIVLEVY